MTKKELVEFLNQYPDETIVVSKAPDGGFNQISEVRTISLIASGSIGLTPPYDYDQNLGVPNAIELVSKSKRV